MFIIILWRFWSFILLHQLYLMLYEEIIKCCNHTKAVPFIASKF